MIEVRIEIERGRTSLFYATSPDLTGLLVADPTWEAILASVPAAVANIQRASGRLARARIVFPDGFPSEVD